MRVLTAHKVTLSFSVSISFFSQTKGIHWMTLSRSSSKGECSHSWPFISAFNITIKHYATVHYFLLSSPLTTPSQKEEKKKNQSKHGKIIYINFSHFAILIVQQSSISVKRKKNTHKQPTTKNKKFKKKHTKKPKT